MKLSHIVSRVKSLSVTKSAKTYMPMILAAGLAVVGVNEAAHAVGTLDANADGQALKAAYDAVNGLSGGYGKALVVGIGFIATMFAILASQATGPLLKFIGVAVFASMGLAAGLTLAGGLI